uniref:Uncharacterized protein n=1 Tax=Glossina morsitans morsitans TaxID=37546 RepID=A0A1B0FAI2_GLOMM
MERANKANERYANDLVILSNLACKAKKTFCSELYTYFINFTMNVFLKTWRILYPSQNWRAYVLCKHEIHCLYSSHCQNIPHLERLRETSVAMLVYSHACQNRLGHKLPLAAYLLKPVHA